MQGFQPVQAARIGMEGDIQMDFSWSVVFIHTVQAAAHAGIGQQKLILRKVVDISAI